MLNKKYPHYIFYTSLAIAFTVAILSLIDSLTWRYVHDSPIMLYAGLLIEHGKIPYKDFFDMNMPGVYFIMFIIGKFFGYTDLSFRIFDILYLISILSITYLWLKPLNKLAAFTAPVLFILWYLGYGPGLSLQREFLLLLPMSLIILCYQKDKPLLIGILTGIGFLIKPHFIILVLPIIILTHKKVFYFILGISIPGFISISYLLYTDAFVPFIQMALNYWPLYTSLNGSHIELTGIEKLIYTCSSTAKNLLIIYVPLSVFGLINLNRPNRFLFGGLFIATIIYPTVSGQFWKYHYIPLYYIAICLSTLMLISKKNIALIIICCLSLSLTNICYKNLLWANEHTFVPNEGIPDEINDFLSTNMYDTDTVQPLDWTEGAVHGMLLAKAPIATRFLYDFHFYHHVSAPYIRSLKFEFLTELESSRPRYIIQMIERRSHPNGKDTTTEFKELNMYLLKNYSIVVSKPTYKIYEDNKNLKEIYNES